MCFELSAEAKDFARRGAGLISLEVNIDGAI